MKTNDIITEANSLPIEERALIVDSLLKSFNNPMSEFEINWTQLSKTRLSELCSGKVKSIPGKEVFDKIFKRFSK